MTISYLQLQLSDLSSAANPHSAMTTSYLRLQLSGLMSIANVQKAMIFLYLPLQLSYLTSAATLHNAITNLNKQAKHTKVNKLFHPQPRNILRHVVHTHLRLMRTSDTSVAVNAFVSDPMANRVLRNTGSCSSGSA